MRQYFKNSEENIENDLLEASFGTWQRTEPTEVTIQQARTAFNKGFGRYQAETQETK